MRAWSVVANPLGSVLHKLGFLARSGSSRARSAIFSRPRRKCEAWDGVQSKLVKSTSGGLEHRNVRSIQGLYHVGPTATDRDSIGGYSSM